MSQESVDYSHSDFPSVPPASPQDKRFSVGVCHFELGRRRGGHYSVALLSRLGARNPGVGVGVGNFWGVKKWVCLSGGRAQGRRCAGATTVPPWSSKLRHLQINLGPLQIKQGPQKLTRRKANITIVDIDVIDFYEAFAAQSLYDISICGGFIKKINIFKICI